MKKGSMPIPCEIIRGIDNKLYIRSNNHMAMHVLAEELKTPICCVGGYDNGFELKGENHG